MSLQKISIWQLWKSAVRYHRQSTARNSTHTHKTESVWSNTQCCEYPALRVWFDYIHTHEESLINFEIQFRRKYSDARWLLRFKIVLATWTQIQILHGQHWEWAKVIKWLMVLDSILANFYLTLSYTVLEIFVI